MSALSALRGFRLDLHPQRREKYAVSPLAVAGNERPPAGGEAVRQRGEKRVRPLAIGEGVALVCPLKETTCIRAIEVVAARFSIDSRSEVELARHYAGSDDRAERYLIIVIPPRR